MTLGHLPAYLLSSCAYLLTNTPQAPLFDSVYFYLILQSHLDDSAKAETGLRKDHQDGVWAHTMPSTPCFGDMHHGA